MNSQLQRAIESLSIQDVYIKSSGSYLRDGFDPKYMNQEDKLAVQLKHAVSRGELLTVNNDGQSSQLFRVYMDMGARWFLGDPADSDVESSNKEKDDPIVEAAIESVFVAEYLLIKEVDQDALNEFALKNASFHVWPYWREYLMSQCTRMNIPKFALPAVQFSKPCSDKQKADA